MTTAQALHLLTPPGSNFPNCSSTDTSSRALTAAEPAKLRGTTSRLIQARPALQQSPAGSQHKYSSTRLAQTSYTQTACHIAPAPAPTVLLYPFLLQHNNQHDPLLPCLLSCLLGYMHSSCAFTAH